MSSVTTESVWNGKQALRERLGRWFSRRRIALSLLVFTCFVSANILIARTIPFDPLAIDNPFAFLANSCIAIGLLIRTWSAGVLNKSREVTTIGPYAVVRNPLYIGSFLMMVGFCILTKDIPTLLLIVGPMSILYWNQVRREEERLLSMFPQQWSDYTRSVPRFLPKSLNARAFEGWTLEFWFLNREYQALLATAGGLLAVILWHQYLHG